MDTLIVHTGGIGDFLLTCPTIEALAKDSRITLAGHVDRLALAVDGGLAQHADSLDSIDFHSLFAAPTEKLVAYLAPFDRIIVWMTDEDRTIERTLHELTTASVLVFPGLPPRDHAVHASEYYRLCLGFPKLPEFRLDIPNERMIHDVIIHPGSGSRDKNWPLERYQELADGLEKGGRTVTWCMGPAETERLRGTRLDNTLECDTLSELARSLAGSILYIGNDSGITHLAAAVGLSTIAVFGPTVPKIWAPRGTHVTVATGTPWPMVRDIVSLLHSVGAHKAVGLSKRD
jgi:hypothetical protein